MPWVYMVRCTDHSFYTGWTPDLENRIRTHNSGAGARYTRGRRPVQLVYAEQVSNKSEALKREYRIRKMSHREKESLAIGWHHNAEPFSENEPG